MPTCPLNVCNGSGFLLRTSEDGEESWALCKCRLEHSAKVDLNEKYIGAFFPVKLTIYTFADFLTLCKSYMDPESIRHNNTKLEVLKNYIADHKLFLSGPDILWISGAHASGRTSLALALGKELLVHNKKVRYIVIEQLMKLFKNFSADDYSAKLEALEKFDTYIIDDIFDENSIAFMTKYEYQQLYSFIKLGLLDNKKFIFISNLQVNALDNISGNGYDISGLRSLIMKSYKEFHIAGNLSKYLQKLNG